MTGRTPPPDQLTGEHLAPARKIAVGVVLSTAILFLRAVWSNPATRALGDRVSEAPAHLWGLWNTSSNLFSSGPFFRSGELNHPVGYLSDLMDPVSLVVFTPVWALLGGGPRAAVLAWNMLHLVTVLLAGLGGWRLARRLVPDPVAAILCAAVCASAPYLMASAQLGRSEYLAGAWYPLHLAFLHAHLGPDRKRGDTAGAILTLIGLAHSGWTLALWVAALEIPVALAFSRQLVDRRERVRRLLMVGVPAVLGALPFLGSVLWLDPWWLSRLQPGQNMPVVLVMPLQNLFRFLTPFQVGGGLEVAPYPGTIVPILMGVALWRRGSRALPWVLFAAGIGLLALGPEIQVAGPTGPAWRGYAPVAWLQSLSTRFNAIQNWPRIACLMGAPLGVAAAWGVAETGRRRPRNQLLLVGVLAGAIVLDHTTWSPTREEPSFDVRLPADQAALMEKLPEGAILELPVDNDQLPEYGVWEDFSLLWQLQHGHPTSEAPSPTRSAAYRHSILATSLATSTQPSTDSCASSEAARLRAAGFRAVLLQKRRVPVAYADTLVSAIQVVLGPPTANDEHVAAWTIPDAVPDSEDDIPEACKAPLARSIGRL